MKKVTLSLLIGFTAFMGSYAQDLNPTSLLLEKNIQIFTLSIEASTSKFLRTDEKLIVENLTSDTINLKILGLCHLDKEWFVLGVTGDLVPYSEAKKHSTFSKKYFANIYKSPYNLSDLAENIDGNFSKIAILAKSGKSYKLQLQHRQSDLIVKVYDFSSKNGIFDDLNEQKASNKTRITTIESDW